MWFSPVPVRQSSKFPVSLAVYRGRLNMCFTNPSAVWRGVFTPNDDGGSWQVAQVTAASGNGYAQSSAGPALIDYLGTLTALWRGNRSGVLFYNFYDDASGRWTGGGSVGPAFDHEPTAAVHEGLLVVAYVSQADGQLYTINWDGARWSTPQLVNAILQPKSTSRPTLVSFRNQLHLFFVDSDQGGALQHYVFAGSLVPDQAWVPQPATGLSSPDGVAAVEWNGVINVLMASDGTTAPEGTVLAVTYNGAEWSVPQSTGDTVAAAGPGAAVLQGAVQLVYPKNVQTLVQATGFAGGTAPLSRTPLAKLGGNASVETSLPSTFFVATRPYTVEAWVKFDSVDGTQYIASSYDGGSSDGLMALALRNGRLAAYRSGQWTESVTEPTAGEWVHVAAAYDGSSKVGLFVNGNLESYTIDSAPATSPLRRPVRIGAASQGNSGTTGLLQGTVRWIAFWSQARSSEELSQDLYARPLPQLGLVALFDFEGADPSDVSGRNHTATVSGTLENVAETQALLLGTSGSLNLGVGNTLSYSGAEAMSLEAWVRLTAAPDDTMVVVQRVGEYAISAGSDGWSATVGGGAVTVQSQGAPDVDAWTHVAVTWEPVGNTGTATLYVDGEVAATGTGDTSGEAAHVATTVGATAGGEDVLQGAISNVQVWSAGLSITEVRTAMTQSPIGMDTLAANYDFSATPIIDTTLNNDDPIVKGSAALGIVVETITAAEASETAGIDTSTSNPFYPDELVDLASGGFQASRSGRTRSVDEILSDDYLQALLETFDRAVPTETPAEGREALMAEQRASLQRAFLAGRADPNHGLGGHSFEWEARGDALALVHTLPSGARLEIARVDARTSDKLALWWIQFTLTLVVGFASIIGVAVGHSLSSKLLKYITKNPAIIEILEEAIEIGADITPEIVFDALGSLWDAKFLLNMIKIIAKSLSWWALGKLAIKLASMFIPGAQELQVATMLVNLTLLGVQLSLLALQYPGNE